MSEDIYRLKSEWIDGHKLVKTVDIHSKAFFSTSYDVYELGFQMFDLWGTFFCLEDGTAFSGEIFLEDIDECIEDLSANINNYPFTKDVVTEVINDFKYMRDCCEQDDEDYFQIYIL